MYKPRVTKKHEITAQTKCSWSCPPNHCRSGKTHLFHSEII